MTEETFDKGIADLRSEWPDSFGGARKIALWELFKAVPDIVFKNAVRRLVLNGSKYPPRAKEFEEQIELARLAWHEEQWLRQNPTGARPPPAEDTRPTPERLRMVHDMVQGVLGRRSLDHPPGIEQPEARAEELRDQLRVVSGRDKAAGKDGE